jgi:hypothetical protein
VRHGDVEVGSVVDDDGRSHGGEAGLCRVMKWDEGGGGDAATRSHAKGQAGGEF